MYIHTLVYISFRCMVTWVSPPSPETWARCSTGKATWAASLPSPQWHASTCLLHVLAWIVNASSLPLQMLSVKREIGSVQREQKCSCLLSTTFVCFQSPERPRFRLNSKVHGSFKKYFCTYSSQDCKNQCLFSPVCSGSIFTFYLFYSFGYGHLRPTTVL